MMIVEDERTLLARLKDGDPRAFDEIYAAWRPRIFSFLLRQVGDTSAAEDMLQETFLRLVSNRMRLENDTDMGAWLFTVARHLAVSHARRRQITTLALGNLRSLPRAPSAPAPVDNAIASQSVTALEKALSALPALYREVLLLVAVEGMAPSRAAQVVGIREEALRKRLSRARAMLSELLSDVPAKVTPLVRGAKT